MPVLIFPVQVGNSVNIHQVLVASLNSANKQLKNSHAFLESDEADFGPDSHDLVFEQYFCVDRILMFHFPFLRDLT